MAILGLIKYYQKVIDMARTGFCLCDNCSKIPNILVPGQIGLKLNFFPKFKRGEKS